MHGFIPVGNNPSGTLWSGHNPNANGSIVKNFSVWGNYRYRVDGPGKFIDGNGMHLTRLHPQFVPET